MKTKNIFLTILLSLFVVSGLWAQDKYEYGMLNMKPSGKNVIVFTTADNEEAVPFNSGEQEKIMLKKLNELNEKGWEVYNTAIHPLGASTYYLRKKKN